MTYKTPIVAGAIALGILILAGTGAHTSASGQKPAHWSYEEADGPARWFNLSPDYALCGEGRSQSPIDLGAVKTATTQKAVFDYQPASLRIIQHQHVVDIIDNGHTVQVNYDEGSVLSVGGADYELKQYHFHAPSEHTVKGKHYPMEMHLVHQAADGRLAVMGVLIDEGARNDAFDPVWEQIPDEKGEETHLEHVEVNVDDLLPEDTRAYRYAGSLTTPPCSEGVSWLVGVQPIQLSAHQISVFTEIFQGNNRSVQPLNGRVVKEDSSTD